MRDAVAGFLREHVTDVSEAPLRFRVLVSGLGFMLCGKKFESSLLFLACAVASAAIIKMGAITIVTLFPDSEPPSCVSC